MKQTQRLMIWCICLILIIGFASAITGKIGNAKMVLRAQPGQTLDKSILVINPNSEPVNIEMFASGDLENFTKIKNANFTLQAGQEKDVDFSIKSNDEGVFNTKINIKFSSLSGTGGIGLSSSIVLITSGDYEPEEEQELEEEQGQSQILQAFNSIKQVNPAVIFLVCVVVITIILLIVLFLVLNKSKKKVKPGE